MTPPPTSPAQRLASSTLAPRPPPHRFGPHILVSLCPQVLISSYPCVFMSSYPYILVSSCPHILISLCLHILVSSYPHVLVSSCPHIPISSFLHIRIFPRAHVLMSWYFETPNKLKVRLIFTGHPHPPTQWTWIVTAEKKAQTLPCTIVSGRMKDFVARY